MAAYLMAQLKPMAHLSLKQRCQMIADSIPEETRMNMSAPHLRRFYIRNGVSFRKPHVKMWGDKDDFSRSCDKLLKMTEILDGGASLIWLDETTVN